MGYLYLTKRSECMSFCAWGSSISNQEKDGLRHVYFSNHTALDWVMELWKVEINKEIMHTFSMEQTLKICKNKICKNTLLNGIFMLSYYSLESRNSERWMWTRRKAKIHTHVYTKQLLNSTKTELFSYSYRTQSACKNHSPPS